MKANIVTIFCFALLSLASLNVIADEYRNAWNIYHAGQYGKAMQSFSELAENGNIYAQAIACIQHAAENRYIEPKEPSPYNPSEVLSRITNLHKAGDVEATFLLALIQDEGLAIDKNEAYSKKLYTSAAESGHIAAQTHLAEYYEDGVGGEKDIKKAIYWYKKAAANGSVWAREKLHILTE